MIPMIELDALIVGAGFGGVFQLKRLREEGFNVKLIEQGTDYGGVWYWNRYPGARVDSPIPLYQFSDPNLFSDWKWSQRFPDSIELRACFAYVAKKWDLARDTTFSTTVTGASWNEGERKWTIRTNTTTTYKCRFFLPNTGFAAKRHIPDWRGMDSFRGMLVHPSYWPKDCPDLRGKKIAVIGTGSTGIQLSQELALIASEFVLFQRTPNMALPMKNLKYDRKDKPTPGQKLQAVFDGRKQSFGGFDADFNFLDRATFEDSDERRRKTYQELWDKGDFSFWLATYKDMLFDDRANTEAYNFWREKVHARLPPNPHLRELLAPSTKPHAFGTKRISLESNFYSLFSLPHVSLVDLNTTPIQTFTPTGITTTAQSYDFDAIILATGFDAITGGLLAMNIRGHAGESLESYWRDGSKTYLGMVVSSFPNMFFTYGSQAPTALCNGPSCAELQGEWIVEVLKHMREESLTSVNAKAESEKAWVEGIWSIAKMSLLPGTKSWYTGDNIPGKKREPLIYLGGVPTYYKAIWECKEKGYEGFELS